MKYNLHFKSESIYGSGFSNDIEGGEKGHDIYITEENKVVTIEKINPLSPRGSENYIIIPVEEFNAIIKEMAQPLK